MISYNTESVTNLNPAAVFTGPARNVIPGDKFRAMAYSSHASAANGFKIEFSNDGGATWKTAAQSALVADTINNLEVVAMAPLMRVSVTNGATLTTFLHISSALIY